MNQTNINARQRAGRGGTETGEGSNEEVDQIHTEISKQERQDCYRVYNIL